MLIYDNTVKIFDVMIKVKLRININESDSDGLVLKLLEIARRL